MFVSRISSKKWYGTEALRHIYTSTQAHISISSINKWERHICCMNGEKACTIFYPSLKVDTLSLADGNLKILWHAEFEGHLTWILCRCLPFHRANRIAMQMTDATSQNESQGFIMNIKYDEGFSLICFPKLHCNEENEKQRKYDYCCFFLLGMGISLAKKTQFAFSLAPRKMKSLI